MSPTPPVTSASSSLAEPPHTTQQTLDQGDFLKLLVAQLSSQDPMNPISNTDFIAQMAQFSTLQETQSMQKNLSGIQSSQTALQASDLLGRTVQVRSGSGTPITGMVSSVGLQGGSPTIIVNNVPYDLSQVVGVQIPSNH